MHVSTCKNKQNYPVDGSGKKTLDMVKYGCVFSRAYWGFPTRSYPQLRPDVTGVKNKRRVPKNKENTCFLHLLLVVELFCFLFFEDDVCYLQGAGGHLQKTEIVWWSVPNFLGGEYVQSFPQKAIFAKNMNVNPQPLVEFLRKPLVYQRMGRFLDNLGQKPLFSRIAPSMDGVIGFSIWLPAAGACEKWKQRSPVEKDEPSCWEVPGDVRP